MFILIVFVVSILIIAILRKKTNDKELKIKREKKHKAQFDESKLMEIKGFHNEIQTLSELTHYIVFNEIDEMISRYKELYDYLYNIMPIGNKNVESFIEKYANLETIIDDINNKYVEKELILHEKLFDNIDGKSLDVQQRLAVARDETNNLVIAGAGSGKTLTISGKVKYLVEKKGYSPNDILLISYTSASAAEMNERVKDRLGLEVEVKTFHKLGFDIIKQIENEKIGVSDKKMLPDLVQEYFTEVIYKKKEAIPYLVNYFAYYIDVPKEVDDFDNLHDYHEYQMEQEYITLKSKYEVKTYIKKNSKQMKKDKKTYNKERVKSVEEVVISNFLFLNGIDYEYEARYPYQEDGMYVKRYTPDFYLPKYDIYIEHFGINENGKCPQYSPSEEKKYIDEMHLKREKHKKYGTTLIETYSYYHKQGILLDKLKELLDVYEVEYEPIDMKVIFKSVFDHTEDQYMIKLTKLVGTFINLFKSRGFKGDRMKGIFYDEIYPSKFLRARSLLFFKIVKPVYDFYLERLNERSLIDFNDMINMATEYIENDLIELNYRYIIIDEYQDISYSRYKLINEIKKLTGAKLLCVGDDWQSIYRFAGSDINLFTEFEYYFGKAKVSRIEKTYRNSQELIDIAGRFVMRNKRQLQKELQSDKSIENPVLIYEFDEEYLKLEGVIDKIMKNEEGDNESSIVILGRNKKNKKMIDKSAVLTINGNKVTYRFKPSLKISYMTVHGSKGLEGDNVIILDMKDDKLGFPNKLIDDPILSIVLTKLDPFTYAEERRLFYVALTRSKNRVYILTPRGKRSIFVKELAKNFNIPYIKDDGDSILEEVIQCPKCLVGQLVQRKGQKKNFVGCMNYPRCDYTNSDIEILSRRKRCPHCGDYLVKRKVNNVEKLACNRFYVKCCNYIEDYSMS